MAFIPIILSPVTTEIRMVLNTELIPPTIVIIALSNCTIAFSAEFHSQGNILTIFAILLSGKDGFLWFLL